MLSLSKKELTKKDPTKKDTNDDFLSMLSSWKWTNMNCILDPIRGVGGLYLGNIDGAEDLKELKKNKITAVLTVAAGTGLIYDAKEIPNHKIIEAEDVASFDLSIYFDSALEFIQNNIKKGNVYVHCFAGVSRSATIVIAYLMKEKKWGLSAALTYVRCRRPIACPNSGFLKHLEDFELRLKGDQKGDKKRSVCLPTKKVY